MGKSGAYIPLALAVVMSAGCSVASMDGRPKPRVAATASEIAALEAQILELQRRAAIADVEIARLQRHVAELESRDRQETSAASRVKGGSQGVTGSSGKRPTGSADAPTVEVSDLPTDPSPQSPPEESRSPTGAVAADAATLTESAQALYDRGYTLFHRGHYVDSETAFRQFLGRHGETVLADNAQFWIAEARYARGDLSGALAAYLETAGRFPNGNKAPDALLKAGECSLELGDNEAARESFRAVMDEFPGSAAAVAARERIGLLP